MDTPWNFNHCTPETLSASYTSHPSRHAHYDENTFRNVQGPRPTTALKDGALPALLHHQHKPPPLPLQLHAGFHNDMPFTQELAPTPVDHGPSDQWAGPPGPYIELQFPMHYSDPPAGHMLPSEPFSNPTPLRDAPIAAHGVANAVRIRSDQVQLGGGAKDSSTTESRSQTQTGSSRAKAATEKPSAAKDKPARARDKPSDAAKVKGAKEKKGIAKGTGSKSGSANRREPGMSDDEIELLDSQTRTDCELKLEAERGLSDDDKRLTVEYITDTDRWKDFKLKASQHWIDISGKILGGRVTAIQVRNYWNNQAWEKYKAVRQQLEHTGGGDGDGNRLERDGESSDNELSASDADSDAPAPRKRKRANSTSKKDVSFVGTNKFSAAVLERFYKSKIFNLIDRVAHDDESIVRGRDVNSTTDIETPLKKRAKPGADTDSTTDSLLRDALQGFQRRQQSSETLDKAKFELERERAKQEERDRQERLALLRQQEEREQRREREKRWELAMRLAESSSEKSRRIGEDMLAKLAAEE